MTQRKAIQTDKAPAAIGPYSQALMVGNTLYMSGQLGIDPTTGKMVEGGVAEQTKQALKNIMAILMEVNMSMHDVVQVQVFY
jgi:2-iminobutanoate/2-iminopropanoate deaminase